MEWAWRWVTTTNDGFPDIYVPQYAQGILYHNNGDGTFNRRDCPSRGVYARLEHSAVWFDYDNDGRLDLFVLQFASARQDHLVREQAIRGEGGNCHPSFYKPCLVGSFTIR